MKSSVLDASARLEINAAQVKPPRILLVTASWTDVLVQMCTQFLELLKHSRTAAAALLTFKNAQKRRAGLRKRAR